MDDDQQKLVAELRALQSRGDQAQQQLSAIQAAASDASAALSVLKNSSQLSGRENLFPIGAGVFLKAALPDSKHVLLDIGAGVIAERSTEDATKVVEERLKQLQQASDRIQSDLIAMARRSDELSSRLSSLQK